MCDSTTPAIRSYSELKKSIMKEAGLISEIGCVAKYLVLENECPPYKPEHMEELNQILVKLREMNVKGSGLLSQIQELDCAMNE